MTLKTNQAGNITERSRKKYRPHHSTIGECARFRPDALALILSMSTESYTAHSAETLTP